MAIVHFSCELVTVFQGRLNVAQVTMLRYTDYRRLAEHCHSPWLGYGLLMIGIAAAGAGFGDKLLICNEKWPGFGEFCG
jgi:hypothetical protein